MKPFLLCLIMAFSFTAHTQNSPALRLHIQGYGLVNPGLEAAWEYPLLSYALTNKKERTRYFEVLAAPVLETYFYKGNHTGLSVNAELMLRYTTGKGHEFQVHSSGGLLRTILHGTVYELDGNNNFVERKWAGNRHTQWEAGFGYGQNFLIKKNLPFSVHVRGGVRRANMPAPSVVSSISIGASWFYNHKNSEQ